MSDKERRPEAEDAEGHGFRRGEDATGDAEGHAFRRGEDSTGDDVEGHIRHKVT
jgi:hypothetical protein